jgi:glycosyltransferase involved in cell wall biosynthesis
MRIAVWHNLPSGGGNRAQYDHVRGLVARGHTVEIWCPPTADRTFLPFGTDVRQHVVDLQKTSTPRRSETWQLTLQIERSLAAMEAHCRQCASEIDRGEFDVLFANSCTFFRTNPIGRLAKTPAVLYLGEPMRALYEAQPTLPWSAPPRDAWSPMRPATYLSKFRDIRQLRNNRIQAREETNNAAAFRRILVNSLFTRESVLRAYGLDSDVCYLGIDVEHFTDRGLPRGSDVVGVGSFTPEKNHALCIEAVAAIDPPRPKLVWIGNIAAASYLDQLRRLAAARGVVFEPMVGVGDETVLDVLNRAAVMIYAPRLEPFGLAPLEANACGLPVVAVAEGGVRETIVDGENGLLVAHDPHSIGAAVSRLLHDSDFARRLGTNARRIVESKWSLASATDRIEHFLRRHARTAVQS